MLTRDSKLLSNANPNAAHLRLLLTLISSQFIAMSAVQTTQDFDFPLTIKYTRRRGSVSFQVHTDQVKILAPHGIAQTELQRLIAEKAPWLNDCWQKQQQQSASQSGARYENGADFLYLGEPYPISIIETDRAAVEIDSGELCIDLLMTDGRDHGQQCAALVEQWLQDEATNYLPARLEHWEQVTGYLAKSLKIRHYKSRWGSCDRLGRITLNNRLMMAPTLIIDYVIIHELAHLKELNHSPRFWAIVEGFCPDYRRHRCWLRQHSQQLQLSAEI